MIKDDKKRPRIDFAEALFIVNNPTIKILILRKARSNKQDLVETKYALKLGKRR